MSGAVIVGARCARRSGPYGGLAPVPAIRLGAIVIAEAIRRAGIPAAEIDEVLMGNVLSAGLG